MIQKYTSEINHLAIIGSGTCNLSCKYCFLCGLKNHKTFDNEIIQAVKDGSYLKTFQHVLNRLQVPYYKIYSFTMWGGECTLHSNLWAEHIHEWLDAFPNVRNVSFVSCGSWVGFLEKQKLLHNYYWVANENSKPFNFNLPIFPPYRENAVFVINKKDFKHDPENYSLCYISSSLDFIPPQEKETYFTFLRALIARYNDKISWIYDSYDNHFKMKMILDGLNKDKKATYEIATEHI